MPEAGGIDTSSYKLPTQPSFLDIAGKYQGLQQGQQAIQSNAIQIDQQKFNLIKDRFGTIAKEVPSLIAKPDLNENDIKQWYQNKVKDGLITADQAAEKISQIPPTAGMPAPQAALTLKNHLGSQMQQAQTVMEALEYHLPKPELTNDNASLSPTVNSRKPLPGLPNGGMRQLQPGIPIQPGPTQPTVSQGGPGQPPMGTPAIRGPAAPPTGLPVAPGSILPGGAQIMGNGMGGVPTAGTPKPVQTQSITTGNPPMFEAGKAQYTADQELATQKLTAIKPALQALPLISGIMSGPGTAAYTHALAGLKAFGFLSTGSNDPVAIRQEVVKKLNAYVSSNPVGQRSDAAQTLAEASSPSPNVQILPALKKLTQDAIALDRVQAARPGAFEHDDFSKYGNHRSTFPAQMDERAFKIDLMEPKERQALIAEMKKKKDTFEGKKFWKSLAIVDKQGLIDTGPGAE